MVLQSRKKTAPRPSTPQTPASPPAATMVDQNTVMVQVHQQQDESDEQIRYEIVTTDESGRIIDGASQVIPVHLNAAAGVGGGLAPGTTIQVFQQQEGIDGQIQLQDVTGNTFVKTIQVCTC